MRYNIKQFNILNNRQKVLLEAEDRVYEQEFMANLETPE